MSRPVKIKPNKNMNAAFIAEQEDNNRLRKADEFVTYCQQAETDAIKALVDAGKRLSIAREKKSILFQECEKRAVNRRKNGQIESCR